MEVPYKSAMYEDEIGRRPPRRITYEWIKFFRGLSGSAAAVWGRITGTLADQTDLQAALDAKVDDSQLDTDTTLAANSDAKIATQKATKAYVDAAALSGVSLPIAESDVTGLVSDLAGKLDDSQLDTDGTLAADSDARIATQKATKTYVDAAVSGVATLPIAESDVTGLVADLAAKLDDSQLDTDGTLSANSDAKIASQKAVKTYIDARGIGAIICVIVGGTTTPTTGIKAEGQIPFDCTITGWTLIADQSGSAQITVKKASYAGYPTTASIVAAAPPNLSSARKNTSTTLTGWTTAITAGDIVEFVLDSVTSCTRLDLLLKVTKA